MAYLTRTAQQFVRGSSGQDTRMGAVRAGLGLALLAKPALLTRSLGADRVTATRLSWLTGMLGGRDLALGAGTVAAARRGASGPWLVAGLVCDAGDAVLLSRAVVRGDVNRVLGGLVALSAVGAVAYGAAALGQTRREPAAD